MYLPLGDFLGRHRVDVIFFTCDLGNDIKARYDSHYHF